MRRFSGGGAYLNFPGFFEEGDQLIREAFGENYERLVALKNKYDQPLSAQPEHQTHRVRDTSGGRLGKGRTTGMAPKGWGC
jgi:hypothetical protein